MKHENGDSSAGSHYSPVLLDFSKKKNGVYTSCGLLPYASLPGFVLHLLSDKCDPKSLTYTDKMQAVKQQSGVFKEFADVSVAFYENQSGEHAMVLPLYHADRFSTKLLFWRVSLICDKQNKLIHTDLESDSSAPLAMTLLRAPLYALNLLEPYSLRSEQILNDAGNCMAMFQASPATPEQRSLFARILRDMAELLDHLSKSVNFFEPQVDALLTKKLLDKKIKEIRTKSGFEMFIGMLHNTNDTNVINTFCDNCEMTSKVCVRNFAGIPS